MVTVVLLFLFGVTVAPFGAGVARAASCDLYRFCIDTGDDAVNRRVNPCAQ